MAWTPRSAARLTIRSSCRKDSVGGDGPMWWASSAYRVWMAFRSASEYTATVRIPSSRQARITRTAISPRLAIRIFSNGLPFTDGLIVGWPRSGAFPGPRRQVALDHGAHLLLAVVQGGLGVELPGQRRHRQGGAGGPAQVESQRQVLDQAVQGEEGRLVHAFQVAPAPDLQPRHQAGEQVEGRLPVEAGPGRQRQQLGGEQVATAQHGVGDQLEAGGVPVPPHVLGP